METRKFSDDVILYCNYLINYLFSLIISISLDLILIQPLDRSYQYTKRIYRYTNYSNYRMMLFCDFNFALFQRRHNGKDTKVKKLMIFKNILNKKELSLNLIIINITTHFRPNFLCTENILFEETLCCFSKDTTIPTIEIKVLPSFQSYNDCIKLFYFPSLIILSNTLT